MPTSSLPKTPLVNKIDPLNGTNFRCWATKLLIHFEALGLDYVLYKDNKEFATQVLTKDKPPKSVVTGKVHEYENLVAELMSKNRDLTMLELVKQLKIEEANHLKDKAIAFSDNTIKANIVEASDKGDRSKFLKGQNKNQKQSNNGGKFKNNNNRIQKKEKVVVALSVENKGTKLINVISEREPTKTLKCSIKVNKTIKQMW
nr:uncharacterized protein LOC105172312 [Ipomoea batatas]